MPKFSETFPSKYLKAQDIPPGRRATLTIEKVLLEEVGSEKQSRPVMYFKGKQKPLVVNKTNGAVLADAFGDEMGSWSGRAVTLFSSSTLFQGKPTACLRLEVPVNARPATPPAPDVDDANLLADEPVFDPADITF